MNDWITTAESRFKLTINNAQTDQFMAYERLLQDWNRRLNLTAITDPAEVRIRHFLDSASCAQVLGNITSDTRLIDVGTGAGFPGLVLKILFPQMQLTLVDSVTKKTRFLQAVVDELGLDRVAILDWRAEQVGQDDAHREQYDWAVARSVAELRTLVEYLLPLCVIGGQVLAQKGESAGAELTAAEEAIMLLGGGQGRIQNVMLPRVEHNHYLVVIPKATTTPRKYPRRPGRPGKRPLGG